MDNPSEFPAYEIGVRVWDMDNLPETPTGLEEIIRRSIATVNIQSLAPNTVQIIGSIEIPTTESSKRFGAQFSSRIGSFFQNIGAQKVNGVWLFATQVRRMDASEEIVFRRVDAAFPLNAAGDVDW